MNESFLWRLKYQPKSLNEIPGREEMIANLTQIAATQDIPHLLFTGPKGYGKMEVARLFTHYVLGKGSSTNCKIVYASDPLTQEERDETRRLSYIPTKRIGSTAGRRFTWPAFIFSRIKPFVEIKPISFHPIKFLIIDDFHLLEDQQQGLRRLMEKYSSYCRMILLTDQISSIIDPIISRCNIIFFKQIDFPSFKERIEFIAKKENLILKGNISKILYLSTKGSLADSISHLQAAATISEEIDPDIIFRLVKNDLREEVGLLLRHALSQQSNRVKDNLSNIQKYNRVFSEIIDIMCDEVFKLPVVELIKCDIVNLLSQIDFRTIDSTSQDLMYDNLIYGLIDLGAKYS
ncbi:MAG: hypothetical protein JW776_00930 [Candidatus Lokiarchaeota archaeon]|nr:hypothetical protein [Candidatus Lokiarchaeota archaeon]